MENDISKKSNQAINDQLQDLLYEANRVAKEIDRTTNDFNIQLAEIEANVDKSIANVEKIYSELDQIEKEAGDELDRLILQQIEELAEE
jgi:PAB1-binding protein PBP1